MPYFLLANISRKAQLKKKLVLCNRERKNFFFHIPRESSNLRVRAWQLTYRITIVYFIEAKTASVAKHRAVYHRADSCKFLQTSLYGHGIWVQTIFSWLHSGLYTRSNPTVFDALVTNEVTSYLNHMGTNRFSLFFTSSYALYKFLYFFRCFWYLLRRCIHWTSVKSIYQVFKYVFVFSDSPL